MTEILLNGKKNQYAFFPDEPESVLRKKGKFNNVYKGFRCDNHEPVVIKVLHPRLAKQMVNVWRFRQEAELDYRHPGTIPVLDFIRFSDTYAIILGHFHGTSMRALLDEKKLQKKTRPSFYIRCMVKILDILEDIHQRQIFHCDIKPSNIMIGCSAENQQPDFNEPEIKLIDFGQARQAGQRPFSAKEPFSLVYSPPEQVLGFHPLINATSDIFSAGITLYELVSGALPFPHDHPLKLLTLQLQHDIPAHEKIPDSLFTILKKATFKFKFARPPRFYKAEEIRNMLTEGQRGRYSSARIFRDNLSEILAGLD
jgi:eukaryotic-like serine/threonine-protein kinase